MRAAILSIALIVFLSSCSAQCEAILATAEGYRVFDVEPCTSPEYYLNFSKKADAYVAVAQCTGSENKEEALGYYRLAGQFYTKAGDHLCESGDAQKKMLMYMSAGQAYIDAQNPDLAITAYKKANKVYEAHINIIPDYLRTQSDQQINMLENPLISTVKDIGPETEWGILPYVLLGVLILAALFFFLYLGR